jgi:DNA-binding transcriptional MocR family regulator
MPSFTNNSLAMRSSPHSGFSAPILRIRQRSPAGIGGRPDLHFNRQNIRQPARCQRRIVCGRTMTIASCQSNKRVSSARLIRVAASTRRGLTPRSMYWASELIFDVLNAIKSRNVVPFGSAFPRPDFFPFAELAQSLHEGVRHLDPYAAVEHLPPGNLDLIRQIARRYMESGVNVRKDEIVITCGALEGLNLCLQAVAQPGDVIAIESPTFYPALEAIERMKLKTVEIATHPREGVDLSALSAAHATILDTSRKPPINLA